MLKINKIVLDSYSEVKSRKNSGGVVEWLIQTLRRFDEQFWTKSITLEIAYISSSSLNHSCRVDFNNDTYQFYRIYDITKVNEK